MIPAQADNEDVVGIATVDQQIEQHAINIERIQSNAIFEMGRELKQAQDLFRFRRDEGGFTGWLAARLPHINQRSAYRAIQRYQGVEEFDEFVKLSGSAQDEVASAEPDVKALIAERVSSGEFFTAGQVKDIKQQAAAEAVARINTDAEAARRDLDALRAELGAKDESSAAEAQCLRDSIAELTAKLKGYEAEVDKFRKSLPKPEKAKEQAAETGGVVLGSDGKFHSGSTAEQKRASNAFLSIFSIAADLSERREPAGIVAVGCPADSRDQLVRYCDAAITYLSEIKEILNGQ